MNTVKYNYFVKYYGVHLIYMTSFFSRRKFESTAESIEESLDVDSGKEDGYSDDDIECDDDDLIEHNCANLNNNDVLYGDSDDKIKGSYYGHDSNIPDQLKSSDEDEAGKTGSNKSRSV